jgi:tRNA threonylcarbamoyladenosine biosynthesis protein TsaB
MNILAFDCCFGAVSAAARRADGRAQAVRHEHLTGGNAERLFLLIEEVLIESGLRANQVDRIAVTLGPGTFTGVRVGVATARALCLALGKPVVGVTSLAAMVLRARQLLKSEDASRPIVVAVDARKGMIYAQRFDGTAHEADVPALLTAADVACSLASPKTSDPLLLVGSGAAAVAEAMRAAGYDCRAELPDLQPHAASVAELATELQPLERVVPLYLRQPDVKVRAAPSLVGGSA